MCVNLSPVKFSAGNLYMTLKTIIRFIPQDFLNCFSNSLPDFKIRNEYSSHL